MRTYLHLEIFRMDNNVQRIPTIGRKFRKSQRSIIRRVGFELDIAMPLRGIIATARCIFGEEFFARDGADAGDLSVADTEFGGVV